MLDILSDYSSYVIISGYVAILFGRTRSTEDVDILIPMCECSTFLLLHDKFIQMGYEFLNEENGNGLYSMLLSGSGVRLCEKDSFIPNIEIKFIKNESDEYSFINRIKLVSSEKTFFISPLEIQIAYKLWLGSDKDIEDAIFLYTVSKQMINKDLFYEFCSSFGVNYEIT
ncbi:MAG: hypothetical protein LUQ50_13760 [Methanospirillum sp.]|uniref:hypothetical protein n=1 Tax=Methanospirillum sp. TaxID=45200 RepID=UPI0023732432|nr:hypothetical protein [Methanospirillum sp.]MDD1730122.1 hypothetical protein [Methanospirillum sp.]